MLGPGAIVLGGGEDERLGVFPVLLEVLIRRGLLPECHDRGIGVHVAILALPRCPRRDLRDADHIEQRDLDRDRIPQIGLLDHRHPHQQPAVGAALDPQPPGRGDLARNQIAPDRGEIVIDDLALYPQPGLVPGRAELAPAADVGEHERAATFEPQLARQRRVVRRRADLEPAIGAHQCGGAAVVSDILAVDHEVGDFSPVA